MGEIKLVVSFLPGRGVNVEGPVGDPLLCYGLLEMAKDAIRAHGAKAVSPIIVPTLALTQQ
jgi:hypothetical protein